MQAMGAVRVRFLYRSAFNSNLDNPNAIYFERLGCTLYQALCHQAAGRQAPTRPGTLSHTFSLSFFPPQRLFSAPCFHLTSSSDGSGTFLYGPEP